MKSPKQFQNMKADFYQNQGKYFALKFVFSKKATKIDEIFAADLTLTT